MSSFRPLMIFWIAVLLFLGGSAVILQYLGPLSRGADRPAPVTGAKQAAPAQPQGLAKSTGEAGKPGGRNGGTDKDGPARTPADNAASVGAGDVGGTPSVSAGATAKAALRQTEKLAAIPEPDAALQEPAVDLPDRMLPRVDDNGRTPAQVYAAPFDTQDKHPRVALLIDGLGLDQAMSEQALRTLPRTVDVAFSAYAPSSVASALATEARRQGRECWLSLPMEPAGFPAAEEGNKALLTGNSPDQNRLNLEWALSSLQGCVGATNASDGMLGERYAESRQSFTELLSVLDHRGMVYLDARPGAPPLDEMSGIHTPPRVADMILDRALEPEAPATADAIDRNLAALTARAAEKGAAIGIAGPPRPVLLERIAVWANTLAAKGLVLAPVTATVPPKPAVQDPPP